MVEDIIAMLLSQMTERPEFGTPNMPLDLPASAVPAPAANYDWRDELEAMLQQSLAQASMMQSAQGMMNGPMGMEGGMHGGMGGRPPMGMVSPNEMEQMMAMGGMF